MDSDVLVDLPAVVRLDLLFLELVFARELPLALRHLWVRRQRHEGGHAYREQLLIPVSSLKVRNEPVCKQTEDQRYTGSKLNLNVIAL